MAKVLRSGALCDTHGSGSTLIEGTQSTSIESPQADAPICVPSQYHDLLEVFSATRAAHLPPHRPWDCAVDLLSDKEPPWSRDNPLSKKETKVMEDYISKASRQGYICRSRSSLLASFFFIVKKDEGLRP